MFLLIAAALVTAGCGGSQSVKAADNAISAADDVRAVADDFEAPWVVRTDAPPHTDVNQTVVQPAPAAAREAVAGTDDDVTELLDQTICAILEYELEYSDVPSQEQIEAYLSDKAEDFRVEWGAGDAAAAAFELAEFAQTLADEGLSEESFTDLILLACY